MSFYVTLPSNSSMSVYKNNLISDYKTDLLVPLKLDGSWEVALTKIIYRNSLSTNIGFLDIFNKTDKTLNSIPIEIEQSQTFLDAFKGLEAIVSRANNLLKGITDNKKVLEIKVTDSTEEKSGILGSVEIILHESFQLTFRGTISKVLNLSPSSIFDINKPFRVDLLNEKVLVNEAFFVYTDIIEEQIVGDTKAPLLDTVALKGDIDEAITVDFLNPHYVNLIKSDIPSIHITIKDSAGENIHFKNLAKVIVKLHFRPKKFENV